MEVPPEVQEPQPIGESGESEESFSSGKYNETMEVPPEVQEPQPIGETGESEESRNPWE